MPRASTFSTRRGWPELRGGRADFNFDGPALHAVASRGSIGGVAFTQRRGQQRRLARCRSSPRAARRETDAGRAIRMLQDTPLAPSFGAMFADLDGLGTRERRARDVPADQGFRPARRHGDGEPRRRHAAPPATAVSRPATSRASSGFATAKSQAPALTGRCSAGRCRPRSRRRRRRTAICARLVNAQGTRAGPALQPVARLPVNAGIAGTADWRGFLDGRAQRGSESACARDDAAGSDLRGLASTLPEPFAKTADTPRPLTIAANFDGDRGPRIQGSLGRDVHALLQWRSKADDPPIERGIVVVRRRRAGGAAEGAPACG